MSEPEWLSERQIVEGHARQLALFGGAAGIRGRGALLSALDRPRNRWLYEGSALPILAAAYGYGLARNHPFVDGNKRVAFLAMATFLILNGEAFDADPDEAITIVLALAAGELPEEALARWLTDVVEAAGRPDDLSCRANLVADPPTPILGRHLEPVGPMADFDREANRFSARAARYARVGANVGGVAARMAGQRLFGGANPEAGNAAALASALGGLKGPIMKVAQLLATVPDLVPPEYAAELSKLQSQAPPMGAAFVTRRMASELGPDWRTRFGSFDVRPAAAASLGQVHRATDLDGAPLACKLQYPDMQSAVEADLNQLDLMFALHRRMSAVIDTREIAQEIGERLREELDYGHEARNAALYRGVLEGVDQVRVPGVRADLSTGRLLTLDWLEGDPILSFKGASVEVRNRLAVAMFKAWWHPVGRIGVIHGDPHLGNYTVFSEGGEAAGINLLDYGCVRVFPPRFLAGVVDLYYGLLENDRDRVVHAYESWGFRRLSSELIDILSIWARFIYGPILEDRVRTVADGVKPGDYGRREAFSVHQALREKGPVTVPREFVFMDRAAIGLGAVFLHLDAELNFHRMFQAEIEHFDRDALAARQAEALAAVGLPAAPS